MSRDNSNSSVGWSGTAVSDSVSLGRRSFLAAVGAATVAGGMSGMASAAPPFSVEQGNDSREITPLSGDQPVEELLQYQLPDGEYDGENGAVDEGGPYFTITGADHLQRDNTSIIFLYDGPNGRSLVVVHGHVEGADSEGGSVSFNLAGMPESGRWVVKDDLYLDPDSGNPAGTNYDTWNVDGTNHSIDWTYGDSRTDGGAFRGLGGSFAITIDPAFNEASPFYEQYYDGDLTDWEVLSGDLENPTRTSLSMDEQCTIGSSDQLAAEPTYTVRQGDTEFDVVPITGELSAEELYDLRLPDQFGGDNGATDPGSGPYYQSVGTQDIQAESTTITFLYDGPDGLSLVVVHDTDGGDGGSATWDVTGLPQDGEWVVKDDLYLDPDTGEPASSNYDRWDTDGSDHAIDWTWGAGGTDGGVFRDLGDTFEVGIDPAYNEDAALWDQYYTGDVVDWQFLSGNRSNPDRTSLALDRPITIDAETPSPPPQPTYTLQQGDTTVELQPIDGLEPIEDRYGLQIPDGFDGTDGATDRGGPYYSSLGLPGVQRTGESVLFLYDGPNGLSLVVVHGEHGGGGTGGSATWTITGLPENGEWVVKDDRYLDPGTGEPASSNYDRWETDGSDHAIDWTWDGGRTDGGAFQDLGDSFTITIDPAYNEQAALYEEYYDGDVTGWRAMSGSLDDPTTTALALDDPVTISTSDPADRPFGVGTVGSSETDSVVTLTGRLDGLGSLDSATVYFEYWESGRKESTTYWWTGADRSASGTFSTELDLDSGTTYRYRALAQGSDGTWKLGGEQEVTTSGQRFGVRTDDAVDVTESGATLTGTLSGLGDAESATVYFEFWEVDQSDDSYWWTGDTRTDTGAFETTLDLGSGTAYRYRALARTDDGKWRAGEVTEFTTGGTRFAVETEPAANASGGSVTLNGTLTGLGDADSATVYFTYWAADARAATVRWYTGSSRTSAGSFSVDRSLSSGTYRYQALARDSTGAWKAGQEQGFTIE